MKLFSLFAVSSFLCTSIHAQQVETLVPNYKDHHSKNIAFFSVFGGSSHYNWVLNIMNELGIRGHNTTFLTTNEDARFGQPYSYVKTVATGPEVQFDKGFITGAAAVSSTYPATFLAKTLNIITGNFERDFQFTKDYFIENNVDVAICDHFAEACFDVCDALNIPFIVTSTMDMTQDSGAPYINTEFSNFHDFTTEHQSFYERFRNKFINPLRDMYELIPFAREFNKRKQALGLPAKIEDFTAKWKNSIKLVNNLLGFSPARPIGPLVELVGPIMPKHYKPLTDDLQQFLDERERVAYIAFGHIATPSQDEIGLILTALLENMESGVLDGFIWATVHAAGYFPDTITTSSNTTYDVQDLFHGRHPDVRIVSWATQTAILLHPSSVFFVSHGGLGSWYESMYAGTRMIMFPFFADQPGNSLMAERSKLGGILKPEFTPEQATELFRKIAQDQDGQLMKNVKRFQALVQIHSEHGVIRAADLVEEVVYTSVNGKLPHRESADLRMSYIKSHNLDLYSALVSILYVCFRTIVKIFSKISFSQQKFKYE